MAVAEVAGQAVAVEAAVVVVICLRYCFSVGDSQGISTPLAHLRLDTLSTSGSEGAQDAHLDVGPRAHHI